MKLMCNVEVNNWSVLNVSRKKPQRCCLAIGRSSVKDKELYILLQTLQNKQGTKYKVTNNVCKIFSKFINDGKATIRFTEPPHDLIIQSDTIQLKSFLHILKCGFEKDTNLSILQVSNLKPKKITSALKTKVSITKVSDYPVLQGFPRTVEELSIIGLGRKSFDRQILKLQNLRILNLSQNNISTLPKELGTLPNLQQLVLAGNHLGKTTHSKWSWLNCEQIKNTLKLLNLNSNELSVLPTQIGKLNALVTLELSGNLLSFMPQSIGSLYNLKYLDISKNELQQLPGSMKNLRLMTLNISENNFSLMELPSSYRTFEVPRLVEIAARAVIQSRKHYNASIIPFTLVSYLDDARYCVCGSPCFECCIQKSMHFDLSSISHSVTSSANYTIPFDCFFCSTKCLRRFAGICK